MIYFSHRIIFRVERDRKRVVVFRVYHGSRRTLHLLETDPEERPVGAHIYGSDPGALSEAAARIRSSYAIK